ncbi:hypothetical protein SeMB42_g00194 [Synchytrium endobioticum]|uniref:GTP:AMP phosphotransferase, mitochondrial n=1 Tax=Synchytrium endobioticum TaxID=286115 RepID=A0A507DUJ9_9FUNG|nr:hypothetical protein SeLEV6574_g06554 [Synchytrium endobioticum]TPX54618.1 hypothetical protein SeMB42_g00194 [Synchytrium endobioticum]
MAAAAAWSVRPLATISISIFTASRVAARLYAQRAPCSRVHARCMTGWKPERFHGIILGRPGSGKGTQTARLRARFPDIKTLSAGDLLRQHVRRATGLANLLSTYIQRGALVPDDVVVDLVLRELSSTLRDQHWILDGFPRTLHQATSLDKKMDEMDQRLHLVMDLDVCPSVILDRVKDRWVHAPSGRVYNLSYNPPQVAGLDDVTGEPLTKRSDDDAETLKLRLQRHRDAIDPICVHYLSKGIYKSFPGSTSDEIFPQLEIALKQWFK